MGGYESTVPRGLQRAARREQPRSGHAGSSRIMAERTGQGLCLRQRISPVAAGNRMRALQSALGCCRREFASGQIKILRLLFRHSAMRRCAASVRFQPGRVQLLQPGKPDATDELGGDAVHVFNCRALGPTGLAGIVSFHMG